ALQHRHDLVVRLAAVDELQPAHHARRHDQLGARDRPLAQHADVERIAVAPLRALAQLRHLRAAIGARHEAVERRRQRGGALRPVHAQVAALLVDLVLDVVERRYLYVRIDVARRLAPSLEPVPRVRTPLREGLHATALYPAKPAAAAASEPK